MKLPRIIYSDWRLNLISWFMIVGGFTFFPWIVLREKYENKEYAEINKRTINHESIHIAQQKELLIILFFIWYLTEWFIRLFMKGNAYKNISFEREAYTNQNDFNYLKNRKFFSWIKYLKK